MKNLEVTFNLEPFKRNGVPYIGCRNGYHIHKMEGKYPSTNVFNRTFYKVYNNNLTAFRVLAWAIAWNNYNNSYLVQFPQGEPQWIEGFLENGKNYNSVDEYTRDVVKGEPIKNAVEYETLHHMFDRNQPKGVTDVDYNWCFMHSWSITPTHTINQRASKINYFMVTAEGAFVGLSHPQSGATYYSTREECVKSKLDGLKVIDFGDEEKITIEIKVTPTQPKEWVFKVTEY